MYDPERGIVIKNRGQTLHNNNNNNNNILLSSSSVKKAVTKIFGNNKTEFRIINYYRRHLEWVWCVAIMEEIMDAYRI